MTTHDSTHGTEGLPDSLRAALGAGDFEAILAETIRALAAESGALHLLGDDGLLHLKAAGAGMPPQVLEMIQRIPVGKGMAGLAVERAEPITMCNLQTDTSGDARPGARATGLEGSIVVPILDAADAAIGSLGVANRSARTFTPDEIATLTSIGRAIGRSQ